MVRVELRADDFDVLDDLLDVVWVLVWGLGWQPGGSGIFHLIGENFILWSTLMKLGLRWGLRWHSTRSRSGVSRLITTVLGSLLLLLLGLWLVHFPLQVVHPALEARLALLVDSHLQQLFILL